MQFVTLMFDSDAVTMIPSSKTSKEMFCPWFEQLKGGWLKTVTLKMDSSQIRVQKKVF